MTKPSRYYAAACQVDSPHPATRDGIAERVRRMLAMVDYAAVGYAPFFDVRLVVFPEFAHAAPIYGTVAELADKLAVPVPNEFTDLYQQKARERGLYIQTGTFLEVDQPYVARRKNDTRDPRPVFRARHLLLRVKAGTGDAEA